MMRTKWLLSFSMTIALLAGSAFLCGCDAMGGGNTANRDSSAPTESNVSVEDQIKKIDADTHMPPAAKEAAKNQLRSHQNAAPMGGSMGTNVQK